MVAGSRIRTIAHRWNVGVVALAALLWLGGLAALLGVAKRVHSDIPQLLAVKLPLLRAHPQVILAGDSHTLYQVDPALLARLTGRPAGSVVNIAYHAGEPLAFLAAIRRDPAAFRDARMVLSVTPLVSNEGIRTAAPYPLDVMARLDVTTQLAEFLPLRVGTPLRFIREAFRSRLAADAGVADTAGAPRDLGLETLAPRPDYRWPPDIATHEHYRGWNLAGPKARLEMAALCDIAGSVRRLTVVIAPWAPRYDRAQEPRWQAMDDAHSALVAGTGRRCGFDVIDIRAVPGLTQDMFYDELHVNVAGIPVYTAYLAAELDR